MVRTGRRLTDAELGRILYEELERLDPGPGEFVPYDELTEKERRIYECAADTLLWRLELAESKRPATT